MNRYYIARITGESGIAEYSRNFYNLVLREKGYIHASPESILSDKNFWNTIKSDDRFFIETGVHQYIEKKILFRLFRLGIKNIAITLHDPPFVAFPLYPTGLRPVDLILKGLQVYTPFLGTAKLLARTAHIYALSPTAVSRIKSLTGLPSVSYLPMVLNPAEILEEKDEPERADLVFFGFIGPKKGVEYALKLHSLLIKKFPDLHLRIIGKAMGRAGERFYRNLQVSYPDNVLWEGFVASGSLKDIFSKTSIAVLPFEPYKYMYPTSASVMTAMRHGLVVCATDVNVISDTVQDGDNGLLISGNVEDDAVLLSQLLEKKEMRQKISSEALVYCKNNHVPEKVSEYLVWF